MCGIAGLATSQPRARRRNEVEHLVSMLRHRGPDASGVKAFDHCVLGHTRLRIIDLSLLGDQPMTNEDSSVWVVYNGEVYNFTDLRRDLAAAGHIFRSRTDTEVLVHLYEEHGEGMIQRLRGMFAFAIWDERRQTLLLARDRLGIKPLYYRQAGPTLRFASEMRALADADVTLDTDSLDSYLRLGWVPGPRTMYREIRELPPGHLLRWTAGESHLARYWKTPRRTGSAEDGGATSLRAALVDSVRRHVVADVPVGLFLSGGVDSIALAHLAAELDADVNAFTVAFDTGQDEADAAAAQARLLGLPHKVARVSGAEILGLLDRVITDMDQPTVDGVNSWVVSRAVRQAGLPVALSGLGGDELFGGYSTFRYVPKLARWSSYLGALPRWARRLSITPLKHVRGRRRETAHRMAGALDEGGWVNAYVALRGVMSRAELQRVYPGSRGGTEAVWFEPGLDPSSMVTELELRNYLPYQLLRDTDSMSMAHSLEVRVPLLDDEVVTAALRAPSHEGQLSGKSLLAGTVHPSLIPLAHRKKQTFTLPFATWLRGPLAERAYAGFQRLAKADVGCERSELDALWSEWQRGRLGWRVVWSLAVLGMWLEDAPCRRRS